MKKVVIIGGGPCGLIAAYSIRKHHPEAAVTVLEKEREFGKRIKLSGNGRCNFSNAHIRESAYKNGERIRAILREFQEAEDGFLQEIHLHFYEDEEGRKYPLTNSSKTVHYLLLKAVERLGVRLLSEHAVSSFELSGDGYRIRTDRGDFFCDRAVVATGGVSYLYTDQAHRMIRESGIRETEFRPSLCPLKVREPLPKELLGKRAHARVSLLLGERTVFEEEGEVLFKKDGVSGIVIFNVSSFLARQKTPLEQYSIRLNFVSGIDPESIAEEERSCGREETLRSYVVEELADYLAKGKGSAYGALSDLRLRIERPYGFRDSQVTSGGISWDELSEEDLSLKRMPGLYAGGECIDVDGYCGGYNLFFAFASGYYIGRHMK